MKVKLEAFGGRLQGTMEWPENSEPRIYLMLDIPRPSVRSMTTEEMLKPPRMVKGTFEWNGETELGWRVYRLVDIS